MLSTRVSPSETLKTVQGKKKWQDKGKKKEKYKKENRVFHLLLKSSGSHTTQVGIMFPGYPGETYCESLALKEVKTNRKQVFQAQIQWNNSENTRPRVKPVVSGVSLLLQPTAGCGLSDYHKPARQPWATVGSAMSGRFRWNWKKYHHHRATKPIP